MAAIVTSAGEIGQAPAQALGRSWWPFDLRWLMPLAGAAAAVVLWMVVPAIGPEPARARLEDRPAPTPSSPRLRGPHGMSRRLRLLRHPTARRQWRPFPPRLEPPRKRRASEAAGGLAARQDRREGTLADAAQPVNEERRRQEADQLAKVEDRSTPAAGLTSAAPAAPRESRGDEANRPAPDPSGGHRGLRHDGPAPVGANWCPDGTALARPRRALAPRRARHHRAQHERGRVLGLVRHRRPDAAQRRCLSVGVGVLGRWERRPGLLTTDARTWRPLTPPSSEDLVAVDATDAAAAVVRAAGGQRFRTTDAGATLDARP